MAIMRPLDEWPVILCGPIVRRVTPTSVAVFVVTKYKAQLTLSVYEGPQAVLANIRGTKEVETRSFGRYLHAAVVEVVILPPHLPLQPGHVYGYDLSIQEMPGPAPPKSLADLGLLQGDMPLGYLPNHLPGFTLPGTLANLRLAHASCRKAHGGGYDALAEMDGVIARRQSASERVQQLLLTGDQIYADDVAAGFLHTLTATGEALLGWATPESIPNEGSTRTYPSTDPGVQPGVRDVFLDLEAGFTSGEQKNHLMYFAEYCAMYLMMWSDALWPRDARGRCTLTPTTNQEEPELDDDTREAVAFAATLPSARRALANVATYMLFDDHEITDDWYLNYDWSYCVRQSGTGRRVVRNGLLAYALFQHWGNVPEEFSEGTNGYAVLEYIEWESVARLPDVAQVPTCCDVLLDVGETPIAPANRNQRMRWDFALEGPEHRVIAMDTRTWREYPPGRGTQAPGLLSQQARSFQLDARRTDDTKLVFLLSPAPVFGQPMVEDIVQKVAQGVILKFKDHRKAASAVDMEAWATNRKSFEGLLDSLSRFGRVVILSGDVHYGFTTEVAYFGRGVPAPKPARFVQLCSSALRNADGKTRTLGALPKQLPFADMGWMGFDDDFRPIRDDLREATQLAIADAGDGLDQLLIVLHHAFFVADRFERPAVLPASPWYHDQALAIVKALPNRPADDWCYRIKYLMDARSLAQRLAGSPGIAGLPGGAPSDVVLQINDNRFIIGDSNVGLIRIETTNAGAPENLVHELLWRPVTGANTFVGPAITEHRASLLTPAADEKPEFAK